jgi:hypothetical protein
MTAARGARSSITPGQRAQRVAIEAEGEGAGTQRRGRRLAGPQVNQPRQHAHRVGVRLIELVRELVVVVVGTQHGDLVGQPPGRQRRGAQAGVGPIDHLFGDPIADRRTAAGVLEARQGVVGGGAADVEEQGGDVGDVGGVQAAVLAVPRDREGGGQRAMDDLIAALASARRRRHRIRLMERARRDAQGELAHQLDAQALDRGPHLGDRDPRAGTRASWPSSAPPPPPAGSRSTARTAPLTS